MATENIEQKKASIMTKALKATIKGVILTAAYFVLSSFIAPFSDIVPGLQQMVETFAAAYIVLVIISEIASGSIYQHFFNAAKAFVIIACLMASLGAGRLSLTFQGMKVAVDVHVILIIAMLLGLTDLARSVLRTVDFINERAELGMV